MLLFTGNTLVGASYIQAVGRTYSVHIAYIYEYMHVGCTVCLPLLTNMHIRYRAIVTALRAIYKCFLFVYGYNQVHSYEHFLTDSVHR